MTEPAREQPPLSEKEKAEARAAIDESAAAGGAGILFAVVNGNGTLARGSGAVSASKLPATGEYQIIFNKSVNRGAFLSTIGLSADSGQSPPGEIIVNLRVGTTNGVFVQTSDSEGKDADRSFHLAVVLP
jgi:hypothetical protein